MSSMKVVEYKGGLVRFRIPEQWIEEREDDDTRVFYQMGFDTGVFRVAVFSYAPPFPRELPTAYQLVRSRAAKLGGTAAELPNGNGLLHYVSEMVEEGKEITQYFWDLANVIPPDRCRIAMFCYTVLKSQIGEPAIKQDLEMLEREISNAEFGEVVGR
ncbi:MAG: hypothetical protein ACREEM_08220 [Blastocatellia bacterium]